MLVLISLLIGIIIFLFVIELKLLHNSFKAEIDMVKLMCFLTVLICIEGLVISMIFNKEKKLYYLQEDTHNVNKVNVYINVSPFIIGKNNRGVNYKIQDDTVSRYHAKIEVIESAVLLTDLGSTNGTFINDKRIEENSPYKLKLNDNVRFSRCKFILKC